MRQAFNPVEGTYHPVATLEEVNSELSIFGTYLGDGLFDNNDAHGKRKPNPHEKIFNRTDGFAVRTKVLYTSYLSLCIFFISQLSSSDQGGISQGHGFIDSILLFPEEKFRHDIL
jgi:hypothetical protein